MTTTRETTALAPVTVTEFSQGVAPTSWRRRKKSAPVVKPVLKRAIPKEALKESLKIADGDPNRLWFGDDNSVWVLNHVRSESCNSPVCPACRH